MFSLLDYCQHATDSTKSYLQKKKNLTIRKSPKILRAVPLIGPVRGNTPIAIYSKSFHDEIVCLFENEFSIAVMKNESYIECMSPPMRIPGSLFFLKQNFGKMGGIIYFIFEWSQHNKCSK